MTHINGRTDCQEPGSAPEPYAWQSSMGYLYLFLLLLAVFLGKLTKVATNNTQILYKFAHYITLRA